MTPWVQRLLIANVLMFFVQQSVAAATPMLWFIPSQIMTTPWTMVTYMFVHGGLWHLLSNMFGLYFFGPRVESRLGSERFFVLYMLSGISGALLSFAFAPNAPIVGASAAIYGILMAYATFWPREKFLLYFAIPVEARWMVIGYAAYSLFGAGTGGGGVAHFAHLGGFVGGFLYLQFIGRNEAGRQFKKKLTTVPLPKATTDWSRIDRGSIHEVNRDEVNRILDKISATGLTSLTPQERLFLSNFVPLDDRPKPPVS